MAGADARVADRLAALEAFIETHGYTVQTALEVYIERMRQTATLAPPPYAGAFSEAAAKAEAARVAWVEIFDPDEEVPSDDSAGA